MAVAVSSPDHPYVKILRLPDARPTKEFPTEAAAKALPPEPPPPRPIINSSGQAIGTRINTTA